MNYRREIDGLRAVAVLPVILFHAGFEGFAGGFVGVDVFFVISGYLITTIILSEKDRGNFSLISFYERRARRILPALFLVMLVSLPFAWVWLLPPDAADFSRSLIAVSTFSSNIFFWKESGYWAAASELQPLLHTWSLAVEEQYYVLFPLFLMLMWRFHKHLLLGSFLLAAVSSLLLAQWAAFRYPSANFFLLPTRGWELAIGATIAFFSLYRKEGFTAVTSNKPADEIMGVLGLLMIVYAVVAYDETIPFPSAYALVPTIGTGLIIVFSSAKTMVGRLLGCRLLVGIGLISYSAYLWHQPLFAFLRHRSMAEPSHMAYIGLSLLSLALAFVSWKCVEVPFRRKRGLNRKTVFGLAASFSILFIFLGTFGHFTDGIVGRSTKSALSPQAISEKWKVNHGLSQACDGSLDLSPTCRTNGNPEIAVWGDSFAMHLVQGILASNPNAGIIQFTKNGCGPIFDIAPISLPSSPVRWAKSCLEFTSHVREWLKENRTIKYVVLSSPFSQYFGGDALLRNGERVFTDLGLATEEFEKTLSELTDMGIIPVVFSPPPSNGRNIGRCLARSMWFEGDLQECNFEVSAITGERSGVYNFLETIEKRYPVVRLDSLICDQGTCQTHFGSVFLYRDSSHLSHEGSAALGSKADFYKMIISSTPM